MLVESLRLLSLIFTKGEKLVWWEWLLLYYLLHVAFVTALQLRSDLHSHEAEQACRIQVVVRRWPLSKPLASSRRIKKRCA